MCGRWDTFSARSRRTGCLTQDGSAAGLSAPSGSSRLTVGVSSMTMRDEFIEDVQIVMDLFRERPSTVFTPDVVETLTGVKQSRNARIMRELAADGQLDRVRPLHYQLIRP